VLIGPGLLDEAGDRVAAACPASAYAVISDSRVAPLLGERVVRQLDTVAPTTPVTFPAGEWNKNRETWGEVSDRMLAAGLGRDSAVVALGGGVVGDLAGFVAATYLRGVPVVQIPTTLLAMIDSSVGGKTGVDTPAGKNLIGAFHQPRLVLADTATLATLPRPQLAAGSAEALKHGAIMDADYFEWLLHHAQDLLAGEPESTAECVYRSVSIKADVVASDEREHGRRAILNFGHTVAHALEAVSGYALLHGEAVALGMLAESRIGAQLGVTDEDVPAQLVEACERLMLPLEPPTTASPDALLDAMMVDKKNRSGSVRFALPRRLGEMARHPDGEWTFAADRSVIDSTITAWTQA